MTGAIGVAEGRRQQGLVEFFLGHFKDIGDDEVELPALKHVQQRDIVDNGLILIDPALDFGMLRMGIWHPKAFHSHSRTLFEGDRKYGESLLNSFGIMEAIKNPGVGFFEGVDTAIARELDIDPMLLELHELLG